MATYENAKPVKINKSATTFSNNIAMRNWFALQDEKLKIKQTELENAYDVMAALYSDEAGLPLQLIGAVEAFIEYLPRSKSQTFIARFLMACPIGKDLNNVWATFSNSTDSMGASDAYAFTVKQLTSTLATIELADKFLNIIASVE